MGNKGAFIKFKSPELKPDIRTFTAVVRDHFPLIVLSWLILLKIYLLTSFVVFHNVWQPHPSVKAMAYASNLFSLLGWICYTLGFDIVRFSTKKFNACAKSLAAKKQERLSLAASKSQSRQSYESMIYDMLLTVGFFTNRFLYKASL